MKLSTVERFIWSHPYLPFEFGQWWEISTSSPWFISS